DFEIVSGRDVIERDGPDLAGRNRREVRRRRQWDRRGARGNGTRERRGDIICEDEHAHVSDSTRRPSCGSTDSILASSAGGASGEGGASATVSGAGASASGAGVNVPG